MLTLNTECTTFVGDVVFVVDASSGSLNHGSSWYRLLTFVIDTVNELRVDEGWTRVGLVTYTDEGDGIFNLNTYYNKNDLVDRIDDMRSMAIGGDRSIANGIKEMVERSFQSSRGDRNNVENIAVVIATGAANEDEADTVDEAEDARADDIYIFSIGLSNDVDENEMESISSLPQNDNAQYFMDSDFRNLDIVAHRLVRKICTTKDVVPVPSPTGKSVINWINLKMDNINNC